MRMSVSKIPASPKGPDEYERRFRVGGARPASVEDVGLAELARKLAPVRPSPEAQAVPEYDQWGAAPIEAATPHSAVAFVRGKPSGPARRDLEATQISGFAVPCSRDLRYPGPATGRRSGPWTRTLAPVGAALLFGAALFVAVFVPKGGSTGARSHITQPALVKIVGSGELPTAVHADASPAATRSSAASEPSPNDLAAPTPVAPQPTAPTSWARIATPWALSWRSQPLRPAGPAPPEATAGPSVTHVSVAAPPDAPQRPAGAVPMVESEVVPRAQPDLARPTKLSRKTPVRWMVAKTATTAPSAATEMRRKPQRPGELIIPSAPTAPQPAATSAAAQEPVHPVTLFGTLAGALGASTVDQTASKGDWAI